MKIYLYRMVGREGFEPPKVEPVDLQSTPFDRSGIDPSSVIIKWSHQSGSNRWPTVYKTVALPAELWWHKRDCTKR